MVCGCDRLGHPSDVRGIVRMALGCSLERVVLLVCFGLGSRNIGEQLDESYRRLLQGSERPRAFLNSPTRLSTLVDVLVSYIALNVSGPACKTIVKSRDAALRCGTTRLWRVRV